MSRSGQQNKLYHELATQLYRTKLITVYDGRFQDAGYPNPFLFRPYAFSYDTVRELLKALDISYPKDEIGMPESSAKITIEQMNKHITFLEVLLAEKE